MDSRIENLFADVKQELLQFGRTRSVDLTPWLDANQRRLGIMARLVEALARRSKDPSIILPEIERLVTTRMPAEAAWFARHRKLLAFLTGRTVRKLEAPVPASAPPADTSLPPDLRTPAERTAANIAAIEILAQGSTITPKDREILRQYSGWGGLSLKRLAGKLPAEWLPEQRGLIHEYYTPTRVARAVAETLQPRLASIARPDGTLVALEPSAGIGRFIEAFSGPDSAAIRWHAAEYSRVSGRLLKALRPDVDVHLGPFESWLHEHAELEGEIDLVVSNPPYGERGAARRLDRDKSYDERQAYAYQMRRALDLLKPGGIGVFLVPAGFLTGKTAELIALRERVLRRHHLMAAFRLPSETEDKQPLFPGALLVTDLLLFRARGGELKALPEEDVPILEGRYFQRYPTHLLGSEQGERTDEDNHTAKPRWGYQVRGTFTGIPAWEERPQCRDCPLLPIAQKPRSQRAAVSLPDEVRDALQLARRVSRYLAELASGEPQALERAAALHADLKDALIAWHGQSAEEKRAVAAWVPKAPELQPLFSVWTKDGLLPEVATAPTFKPRFSGALDDIGAQAHFLYGSERALTLASLQTFHAALGGKLSETEIKARLLGAGFCTDGDQLVPEAAYYTGLLWDKYDRARQAADRGDNQAAAQAARLLQAIAPVTFAELTFEPRLGWLPVRVIQGFVNHLLSTQYADGAKYELERQGSLLTLAGVEYTDIATYPKPLQLVLGYLNHDLVYFRPKTSEEEDLEAKRKALAAQYVDSFRTWLEDQPDLQSMIVEAYNRLFRGWVPPTYEQADLAIARWNSKYPLYGYQNAGVRRLVANHGGGLFFDVGLGKTRTMLAALALARQQGWARRAVIVVPGGVIWNWLAEIERVLPDFRVVTIGAKKKLIARGARKGQVESDTDTPRERADKWERFKAGLYDVALLTYSSLGRTQMRTETLLPFVRGNAAVQREIGFAQRAVEQRIKYLAKTARLTEKQEAELEALKKKYGGIKQSERRQAIKSEKEEAFAAEVSSLPDKQEPDPGIYWEDLGIDWIAFDESHTGKNLWTVGAREGGEPRFLGAPQEGSAIAWQMFFRSAVVRQKAGGSGVHLADATPAKNSPLEFLSLLSFLDDGVWARLGIGDAEQFLTQYLRIESKLIQGSNLEVIEAPCVVGFRNLDQLREILFRYGEFRTAKQVGLKIPEPIVRRIEVDLDAKQEEKYTRYIEAYEQALGSMTFNPESRYKALGLLQRMALVAVHAELDEAPEGTGGWSYANASRAQHFSSPKFAQIAALIAEKKDCGHIVFLENNAAHYWLRETIAAAGIPIERIAVLNGETAPTTLTRQRIAEGFTNEPALYDVIIANRIAYEGLNLQNRTCAIYHGDLPMEPATLQQRNGRGQRQGNRYDVIYIYYVLAKRSMDMARFQLIAGKREWMAELLESAASETNNPAAQAEQSPEDWLMYLSRDPQKTQALFAAKQAKQAQAERDNQRKIAWARIRGIAVRQRELAGSLDAYQQERLRKEIAQFVEDLNRTDPDVWPWKFAVPLLVTAGRTLSFAPAHEGAIWEGARCQRKNPSSEVIEASHYGRIQYIPRLAIGLRDAGSVEWREIFPDEAQKRWSYTHAQDWTDIAWPAIDEELGDSMKRFIARLKDDGVWHYHDARFDLAPHDWLEAVWTHWGKAIVSALSASRTSYQVRLPIVTSSGLSTQIAEMASGRVLPFTDAGYQEFLKIAQSSALKWTELDSIAQWWWLRHLPRTFLVEQAAARTQLAA